MAARGCGLRARLMVVGRARAGDRPGHRQRRPRTAVLTIVSYRTLDASAHARRPPRSRTWSTQGRLPGPDPGDRQPRSCRSSTRRDRVVSASANADRLTALLLPAARSAGRRRHAGRRCRARGSGSARRCGSSRCAPGRRRGRHAPSWSPSSSTTSRTASTSLRATLLVDLPAAARSSLGPDRVAGHRARRCARSRRCGPPAERISGSRPATSGCRCRASGDEIHALAVTLNSMLDRLAGARRPAADVRRRRGPRAAQPPGLDADPARGRPAAGGGTRPRRAELHAEVVRLSGLVDDLLVLARLDADDARPSPVEPVDVAAWRRRRGRPGRRRTGAGRRRGAGVPTARRARATRGPAAGAVATWSTTPSGTPARTVAVTVRRDGRRRRGRGRRTTARASRRRSATGSSSGSPGSTTPATATPAAAGSGWPSSASWSAARRRRAAGRLGARRAHGAAPAAAGRRTLSERRVRSGDPVGTKHLPLKQI